MNCGTDEGHSRTAARERFERWRRLLQASYVRLSGLYLPEVDAEFWDTMREALLDGGATEREIDAVAMWAVCLILENVEDGTERREQWELVAEHLACTAMTIRLGQHGDYAVIEFPDRPQVH